MTTNSIDSSAVNLRLQTDSHSHVTDLKIVTNLTWPSFRNVSLDIQKALQPYCHIELLDWRHSKPTGKILFMETVRKDTLKYLGELLPNDNIVFYGTTEGHSVLDEDSLRVAKKIKIVAVSDFVRQMLEEVGLHVAGIVHHGLDMEETNVNSSFVQSVKDKVRDKLVALTISSNDVRKGLDSLLRAFKLVEAEVPNSFLILHSQPKRYYNSEQKQLKELYSDLPALTSELGLNHIWLTNSYGMMTPEEVNGLYQICNFYVFPSFSEGFGLPIIESFRFSKPVIAVDAPPFNEIIKDGQTGKLIPYNDVRWFNRRNEILFKMHIYEPNILAKAIMDLMTNAELRENMRKNIESERCHWSIHKLYPQLLNYF
ncbi:MAG: hypothetical protein QG670_294 [Thermoproteota archaeon]|nr:hypothetical protein [Thermoproteota archaeon]